MPIKYSVVYYYYTYKNSTGWGEGGECPLYVIREGIFRGEGGRRGEVRVNNAYNNHKINALGESKKQKPNFCQDWSLVEAVLVKFNLLLLIKKRGI